MPGINMLPQGSTLQIPLDACTNFSAEAGNAQVTLTWTDPLDKYATPEGETAQDPDQLVSVWDHTVLVRKTGSQPAGPNDGTVVVSSSVRNQYQSTAYVDSGLTNDTTYYYGVFAYNKDGVASSGAFVSATPRLGTPIGELAEGTLITITENGAPVEFYVAKQGYEPSLNSSDRVLMVRKDVYDQRQWNSSNVNAWAKSTMRSWLNNGYKGMLSANVQTMIGATTYRYTPGNGNTTVTTRSDSVFLLSLTELGSTALYAGTEGNVLPIASALQAVYDSSGGNIYQWTRSPSSNGITHAYALYSTGNPGDHYCTYSMYSRPCFTLPATALIDSSNALIES